MSTKTHSVTSAKLLVATGILFISIGVAALVTIPAMQGPEDMNPREVYNELAAACADETCTQKIQECFSTDCYLPLLDCFYYWTKDQCSFLEGDEYISCEENIRDQCVSKELQSSLVFKKTPVSSQVGPAPITCLDSDAGADFAAKGSVTSALEPSGKEDYCYQFADGSEYLMEGICLDDTYAQLQKNCKELGAEYVCKSGICKQDKLSALLENQDLKHAVGFMTDSERSFLYQSFEELEKQKTDLWHEFDEQQYLTLEETRKIWLRRVAFILYGEAYKKVPWSIFAYTKEHLALLLKYCNNDFDNSKPLNYSCSQYFVPHKSPEDYALGKPWDKKTFKMTSVWSANPIVEFQIGETLINTKKNHPNIPENTINTINTQRDLIDSLIIGMRQSGWGHKVGKVYGEYPAIKITDLMATHQGGSGINALFLVHILRSWGVPAQMTTDTKQEGHGTIFFTTENIALPNGDYIQSPLYAVLPVKDSYISAETFNSWYFKNSCEVTSLRIHNIWQKILSYHNDPTFGKLSFYKNPFSTQVGYCINPNFLEDINSQMAYCEYSSDNKGFPVFTAKEVQDWTKKLQDADKAYAICPTHNALSFDAPFSVTYKSPVAKVSAFLSCDASPGAVHFSIPYSAASGTYMFDSKNVFVTNVSCPEGGILLKYFDENNKMLGNKRIPGFPFAF